MTAPGIYICKRVVQAKLFIDRHYGERIDLGNIADEACFSKFHFIRIFRSIYGKTPHSYLTSVRIGHAKTMLDSGHSVSDTCFNVGFDSIPSFSNLFRQHTGHSPARYRANRLQRAEEIRSAPLLFVPSCFAQQNGWAAP